MSSEDRRASIVDAACRLFSDKGFRGVTTRELAAAVGVTEPVLYEHFRTKRELYSALIESKAGEGFEALQRIHDKYEAAADDLGFFQSLADSILEWYGQDPAFVRLLLFSSLEGHELKDLFHERSCKCFGIVSGYIERRIAEGAMRPMDPMIAARAFFGMVAHYALTAVVFGVLPLAQPPEVVVREMAGLFLGGLSVVRKN